MTDRTGTSRRESPLELASLVAVGLGAGLSPFFYAYYDASVWAPVGLCMAAVGAFAWIARPATLTRPAALALAGVAGLGLWSLISIGWTSSVENAVLSGDRWLSYAALLVLLLALLRSERAVATMLAAAGAGIAVVALYVLVRLLGNDPSTIFLGGRLNLPLGYINGEGCLFAMGFWLCLAAAESRRAPLAGAAMALATLMGCLVLLSQSRGAALAMFLALLVVVVALPGRVRRAYALGLVAVAVALAGPSLLHVFDSVKEGSVTLGAAHEAGYAALLAALAAGVVWGFVTRAWNAAYGRGRDLRSLRAMASWALAAPVVLALALAVGAAHPIEREISAQWRAFTHLAPPIEVAARKQSAQRVPGAASAPQAVADRRRREPGRDLVVVPSQASAEDRSRLLSGAGNRYDYWRIAWGLWREHPLAGVGAGGYAPFYYRRRATTEDIEQPHSIELEALSELGLVGAALLALLFGSVAWGVLRSRRFIGGSGLARACTVGATGCFVAWAAQASVDWMLLLPGLTAVALIAAAALLWSPVAARPRRGARLLVTLAVLATLVVAGGSLVRQALAQLYANRAAAELASSPASAVAEADRSLEIDSAAVQTYYVKAAAQARLNQADKAETALLQALDREPENFVTWTLLGDIATREGRLQVARGYYRRAHALNPRNVTIAAQAGDSSLPRPR